jgi:hypothetical protein
MFRYSNSAEASIPKRFIPLCSLKELVFISFEMIPPNNNFEDIELSNEVEE